MSRTCRLKVLSSHWEVDRSAYMPLYHTPPGKACPALAGLGVFTPSQSTQTAPTATRVEAVAEVEGGR